MAGETPICVVGNLVADPELRWTQAGKPVANVTIASTPRAFNRQSGEWEDQDALFMRGTVWGNSGAENVAESFRKGDRVIAVGTLRQRSFETREGERRTVVEMTVDEIGPSSKWAMTRVNRTSKGGGGGQRRDDGEQWASERGRGQGGRRPGRQDRNEYDDPWGSAPPPAGARSGGDPYDDEAPF